MLLRDDSQLHILPTVLSTGARKLHLVPQPCICCVHGQRQWHCGWSEAVWSFTVHRKKQRGLFQRLQFSDESALQEYVCYHMLMGTNMYCFPGEESGRDRGLLTAACHCGSQGDWGNPSCHSRYFRVCKLGILFLNLFFSPCMVMKRPSIIWHNIKNTFGLEQIVGLLACFERSHVSSWEILWSRCLFVSFESDSVSLSSYWNQLVFIILLKFMTYSISGHSEKGWTNPSSVSVLIHMYFPLNLVFWYLPFLIEVWGWWGKILSTSCLHVQSVGQIPKCVWGGVNKVLKTKKRFMLSDSVY